MLKLQKHPKPILKENLSLLKSDWKKIKTYHREVMRLCQEHKGIGIAANQVGLEENFFFVAEEAKLRNGKKAPHMCINPTWEPTPKSRKVTRTEGCLSLPGREFKVDRHTEIIASWDTAFGHRVENVKLKGLGAQVFQHEHDHLRGLTLLDTGEELT